MRILKGNGTRICYILAGALLSLVIVKQIWTMIILAERKIYLSHFEQIYNLFPPEVTRDKLDVRHKNILEFCGELCNLSKPIQAGSIVGTVTSKVDCDSIFASDEIDRPSGHAPLDWHDIPIQLKGEYTHYGQVKIGEWFLDNSGDGSGRSEYVFSQSSVQSYVDAYKNGYPYDSYNGASVDVGKAIEGLSLEGANILVIGTQQPWLEAIILTKSPKYVLTLEYGKFRSEYPGLEFIQPDGFRKRYIDGSLPKFDYVFTFSSVEHSGLGRYGDALNPWGDILTVARAWCVSSPQAKMVIGVPTGSFDKLEWNAHRVYGPVLYPYLMTNWKFVLSSRGSDPAKQLKNDGDQPVYVFEKMEQ